MQKHNLKIKTVLKLKNSGFTLPELLVAVAVFALVVTIVAHLYSQSFISSRKANSHNQIYEDGRYILGLIANEIRHGMVDYDEYYNQNVVIPSLKAGIAIPNAGLQNFGQNYGRYYSSFFHPGSDAKLGFLCNDGGTRNDKNLTPLRKTLDKNTGQNSFSGKIGQAAVSSENAFCGTVKYEYGVSENLDNKGLCASSTKPLNEKDRIQVELYLISADGKKKTILARERTGGSDAGKIYALSILRMDGVDTDSDGIADKFICADEFQCLHDDQYIEEVSSKNIDGCEGKVSGHLPRNREKELENLDQTCDSADKGFSKDFVPISPLRVNIKDIKFLISPSENPHYAFAETSEQKQPAVTIELTIEPNSEYTGMQEKFNPITLVETVSSGVVAPIPAPVLVE